MHSERGEHRETEEAQYALDVRVAQLTEPPDTAPESERTARSAQTRPRRGASTPPRRSLARPWFVAVGAVLLLGALILMLADVGHPVTTGRAAAQPTSTPKPTATATVSTTPTPTPTATPLYGFQYYTDPSSGFVVQYPTSWVATPTSPGVELTDNSNSPGFIMQILLPSNTTLASNGTDPTDPAALVDYELNNLAKQWPQGDFQRVPGPDSVPEIGGVKWQGGVGLVSANSTHIRVQVYATVHNGKPYVINLLASDDLFDVGTGAYFLPMLKSFQFLPANNS